LNESLNSSGEKLINSASSICFDARSGNSNVIKIKNHLETLRDNYAAVLIEVKKATRAALKNEYSGN